MNTKTNIVSDLKGLFVSKGKETFASRLHHLIGCWVVGTPKELKVDDDFWFDDDCRTLPSPEEYDREGVAGHRLVVETFRQDLRWKLARVAPFFAFAACAFVWVGTVVAVMAIQQAGSLVSSAGVSISSSFGGDGAISSEKLASYTDEQLLEQLEKSLAERGKSMNENLSSSDLTAREVSLAQELQHRQTKEMMR